MCDLDRGVTSIGYNILNLPEKVLLPGNHETYNIYDADGRKLRTIHIVAYDPVMLPGGETVIPADTLVRDYSGGHIYENGVLERTLTPTGYYSAADSEYCHYIKDYQGNNIAVVKADANGAPEVVSATLMYPFGGELTEMSATDRYRFGGKEFDTRGGLFHYDFGARHYDPVLPMFNGYDRRAEKYYHLSPFAYCAGNPVRYIDPSGEDYNQDVTDNAVYISAVFLASDDESMKSALKATNIVNNNSYQYAIRIETEDGTIDLPIVFCVTASKKEGTDAELNAVVSDMKSNGVVANLYKRVDLDNGNTVGSTKRNYIKVFNRSFETTGAHELGHALGMLHDVIGLMTESSLSSERNKQFSVKNIHEMIFLGNPDIDGIATPSGAVKTYNNHSKYTQKQLLSGKIVKYKKKK